MAEMLTAKDVQGMLQVDRSTVYRMAEAGQLPAIKVGKQWRFPSQQFDDWFQAKMGAGVGSTAVTPPLPTTKVDELNQLLPMQCVQLIQNAFADLLGIMIIVTDIDGSPITEASNPCGLFTAISEQPNAVQRCIQSWHDLAAAIDLTPQFSVSHLGLLCARSMIRVDTELKGMVIAGCIAPSTWPPSAAEVEQMAQAFGVEASRMTPHLQAVYDLNPDQKANVLAFLPRIANIIAHIVDERKSLVERLQTIAQLTQL